MSEKKAYPLRISVEVLDAVQRWADDELRSVNAQIEYVLRDALRKAGRLGHLLASDHARQKLIIKEIEADAAKYGDRRRSELKPAEKATLTQTVADEPVTLILSKKGWLRARVGHHVDLATLAFKDGDALATVLETRTIWPVVVLSAKDDSRYLVASSGGYGFIAQLKDMVSRVKAGKAFLTVEDQESALPPVPAPDHASAHVLVVSQQARLLAFALDELKQMGRGRGLQLLALDDGDALAALGVVNSGRALLTVQIPRSGRLDEVRLPLDEFIGKRGRRGKEAPKRWLVLGVRDAQG